jgi:hypothetical protein
MNHPHAGSISCKENCYTSPMEQQHAHLPYYSDPIPVCYSLDEVMEMMDSFPEFKVCFYLSNKSENDWDISKKRSYMNQVIPKFLYIPLSLPPDQVDQISGLATYAIDVDRVIAIDLDSTYSGNETLEEVFSKYIKLPSMYDLITRSSKDSFVAQSMDGHSTYERDYAVLKNIAAMMHTEIISFEKFSNLID